MKTKLLKKVRNNYRIVVNELGESKIQQKSIFGGWCDDEILDAYDAHIMFGIYGKSVTPNIKGLLNAISYKYSDYSRKNKIRDKKKNTWKVIWYKK